MSQNLPREEIEEQAKEDLSKTDLQLLTDIHQEILRNDRPVDENADSCPNLPPIPEQNCH